MQGAHEMQMGAYLQHTEQPQLCVQRHVLRVARMHGVTCALHEHCHAAIAAQHLCIRLHLHLRCPWCRRRMAAPASPTASLRSNTHICRPVIEHRLCGGG